MSARLTVQRFEKEKEDEFETLHITFVENDKLSETKIGEWHVAKEEINKEKERSRLIVKVVSDEISCTLDLDSCAIKIETVDQDLNILKDDHLKHTFNDFNKKKNDIVMKYIRRDITPNENIQNSENIGYLKNPLEYSLQKVQENNAKIMENIHILNKTLNYTRKNEILGIINPKLFRSYPCEECGKCFVYETGLRKHHAVRHSSLDSQQRWQFVWTCTECFQVWPRQDLALNHAKQCCKVDTIEFLQEIKTSSVLQCEFCEKVFTNIPRLLRHLKMHTVKKNYECNPCNIAFSCYKTAEQHWLSCVWLKMYYQFSLPKLLLCHACDRKFRNYDQLYNHRYKVDHFLPKLSESDDSNFIPILVFQCEVCGQWFNAIAQIHNHRNVYHPQFNSGPLFSTDAQAVSQV